MVPAEEPLVVEVPLPPFRLEAGAALLRPRARVWFWGTKEEHTRLAEGEPLTDVPEEVRRTVCIMHTLTGALDPRESFPELFGRSRPLRPWADRIVAVGLLGSRHDPTGPGSGTFPTREADTRHPPPDPISRGAATFPESRLPATVTPWDQARAADLALRRLGLTRIDLAFGASLGGMVALALAALMGERMIRALVVAAPFASSAWVLAHDHVVREALLADPEFPHGTRTARLARQIGFFGYRGREALIARQGRETAGRRHEHRVPWNPRMPYRIESYFRHLGEGPQPDPRCTVALLGAMDHHDLGRTPPSAPDGPPMADRIRAHVTCASVSSDTFVRPEEVEALAHRLPHASYRSIASDFGHDGFLVEKARIARLVRDAATSVDSAGRSRKG